MRIKLGSGLLPINILALVLVLIILFNLSSILRIILGLPFLLFCPGYSLLLALFPRRDRLSVFERVALSFGMSIAVVPLIGLLLNYTPWGIRLEPVLYSVVSFNLVMSIIGWLRLKKLEYGRRFSLSFSLKTPGWGGSVWDRVLSIILIVSIVGALGTLVYVIATPKTGEQFTEFYILGEGGQAGDYPHDLKTGEAATVIVGLINHEQSTKSYWVEVQMGEQIIGEAGPVTLENDEKWEVTVTFIPTVAGDNQKVEFVLYKDESTEPSEESLHLWINVTD